MIRVQNIMKEAFKSQEELVSDFATRIIESSAMNCSTAPPGSVPQGHEGAADLDAAQDTCYGYSFGPPSEEEQGRRVLFGDAVEQGPDFDSEDPEDDSIEQGLRHVQSLKRGTEARIKGIMSNVTGRPNSTVSAAAGETSRAGRLTTSHGRASVLQREKEWRAHTQQPELEEQSGNRRWSEHERRLRAKSMALNKTDIQKIQSLQRHQKEEELRRTVRFEVLASALLITNLLMLGFQTEYKTVLSPDAGSILAFKIIDTIYALAFTVELGLRMHMIGFEGYLSSKDRFWHLFDVVVVLIQLVEIIFLIVEMSLQGGGNDSLESVVVIGRIVRLARIVRIVRVIRVMRALRPFKILINAIYGTLKSCLWALILLVIIMYGFALIFAETVHDHLAAGQSFDGDLHRYFGSLSKSIFTLAKAVLGGMDWQDAVLPLEDVSPSLVMLFTIYVVFVNLAVMNVVAGLFLQSALTQAQQDQDHLIQQRLAEKEEFTRRLRNLFERLDTSMDGDISLAEFETHLEDDHMKAFLESFEIDPSDAWTLFRLLDADGGGSVDSEEFVDGCIRLKGNAKTIHVAQLTYHHKWIMDVICELSEYVHESMEKIGVNKSDT
eukprot:TRINITY_DN7936_c0_g3_i2.p1 TRINITY_DN7936_c0_g3~~TRINITY_DN7936_c0_g3_i2.p1  ORF type:complete len:679 (+),score=90.80 TRINITY_DN7936_c0_g3_i2:218-2038(+)